MTLPITMIEPEDPDELMTNAANAQEVVARMLTEVQIEDAKKKLFDVDAVDTALLLEGRMKERIEEVFNHAWNEKLRFQVEKRIQEEIAQLGLSLGKNLRDLTDSRMGKL